MNIRSLAAFVSFLVFVPLANAQEDSSTNARGVTGTGSVTVKQTPTILRMSIQFRETGKDVAAALKSLKDRRDASKAQLIKLGAKDDSFVEGAAKTVTEDPQMARAMMMASRQGGSKKKKKTASKVTVAGTMTCEWSLPAKGNDEALLFTQGIKDKVQEADLAGQKDEKKLTADEQEEMEEMEMMQQQYGGQQAKPGEPTFMFLAKLPKAEEQKARAAAYQKAKTQAEQLAVAAGKKLGKLRTLSSSIDGTYRQQHMMNYYNNYNGDPDSAEDLPEADDDDLDIGVSRTNSKVQFSFSVHATFDFED